MHITDITPLTQVEPQAIICPGGFDILTDLYNSYNKIRPSLHAATPAEKAVIQTRIDRWQSPPIAGDRLDCRIGVDKNRWREDWSIFKISPGFTPDGLDVAHERWDLPLSEILAGWGIPINGVETK